jgi:hypothetical protein
VTAYVEELGGRDEIAELIEGHFKIVWVFLSDDQANRAGGGPGQLRGFGIHGKIFPSGIDVGLRGATSLQS